MPATALHSASAPPGGVRAPTGTALTCRGWAQEAAFRMLQNNLDPDVAERPDDLVVYGGTGRAARSWDAYHAMIRALIDLGGDETLLVQSGKPVGVLRTHEWAPRVLIANSNLVPEWGTWDEFRRLEHLGLTMYGQMTAGSWIYIGTQGILQGTYECFGAIARKQFGGSLAGTLTVTAGLGGMGGAQPLAVTMNEGVALCIEVDPRVAARLDPDRYHRLARAVFAEMALAGIGVVGEFHYVHHRPDGGAHDDPGAMGKAVVAAARDAGIRLSLLDTLYLHGGLDPASDGGYGPLRPEQARFSDGSAERWADRAEELASAVSGPAVRVGAAVHSVRAVDPPSIKVAADWARERGAPLHFHASEQPAENQQCLDVHGMTPTEVIARAGGLGPGTTLVHATHACERDQAMIGGAGSHCCLCPTNRARPGRRHRTKHRPGRGRGRTVPGLGLPRHSRHTRRGPHGRARPAGGHPRPGRVLRGRPGLDGDRRRLPVPRMARGRHADFSTRQPYPDARRAIDAGVRVAIASNCNPGSSYTTSLSFCIAIAVRDMGMTIDEAVAAVTVGGAGALGRTDVGRIAPGGPAHVTILDAPSRHHLAYRPGVPLIWRTLGADYRLPTTGSRPPATRLNPLIHKEKT